MSLRYLRLYRDELKTSSVTRLSEDIVSDTHKSIRESVIESLKTSGFAKEFIRRYMEKNASDVEGLVRARFLKTVLGLGVDKNSIDSRILAGVEKAIEVLRDYLLHKLLIIGGSGIVVVVRKKILYNNVVYRSGDVCVMDLETAVIMHMLGYVEPIRIDIV